MKSTMFAVAALTIFISASCASEQSRTTQSELANDPTVMTAVAETVTAAKGSKSSSGATPTETAVPTPDTGAWVAAFTTDELTDVTSYVGVLVAASGENIVDTPFSLIVFGCEADSDNASVAISWENYIATSEFVEVAYRVDDRPVKVDGTWWASSDGTTTYRSSGVKRLIQELSSGNQFIARITPYNEGPITGTWNLHGLATVANTIAETCGW